MAARIVSLLALLAGLVTVVLVTRSGGDERTLRATFDSAVQVVPGQEVRIAGRKVGAIGSVEEREGDAVVELVISDASAWPLRQGTKARLRWGSTSGYALRYVELSPGPASAVPLPDEGLLPRADTTTPVELDEMYRIFRGSTRGDLGRLVDELGQTFGGRADELARALREAPAGIDQTAELLRELGADNAALRSLVVAGDRTTSALATRNGQLRAAVDHAAQTFDTVAHEADSVTGTLERLPQTLDASRDTLGRLDRSLVGLQGLVDDLRPGTRELRSLAPVARRTLAQLRQVAPLAASTLRRGSRAAPPLARFLRSGTGFLPRLGRTLDRLAPMAGCLRPYGPELAGFLSTWTGFTKNYDAQGHFVRAYLQVPPIPVGSTQTAEQAVSSHGGNLVYAMPRPPGFNAGQPWFQPQCGAGPDALDASKDPEGTR